MPRQSAAVYRRRRLAVLVLVLVLTAAVAGGAWVAFAQPWKPAASATPRAAVSPAATSSATPSADASRPPSDPPCPDPSTTPEIVACGQGDVEVEAVTDADAYAAAELPQLSIRLTSTSDVDCTLN